MHAWLGAASGLGVLLQVSEQISERTKEFIAANAGVDLTRKLGGDSKLSSTELALIVKSLPVSQGPPPH